MSEQDTVLDAAVSMFENDCLLLDLQITSQQYKTVRYLGNKYKLS